MEDNQNQVLENNTEEKKEEVVQKEVDYNKLEEIINKGIQTKESAILKSYFQQMGMSEEEVKTAVDEYKSNKAKNEEAKKNDNDNLAKELQELKNSLKAEKLNSSINNVAYSLGLDAKSLKAVNKLADFSDIYTDGKVDEDKIRESINNVLNEYPGLKSTKDTTKIVEVGSPEEKKANLSAEDDLRRAFGLKPKNI